MQKMCSPSAKVAVLVVPCRARTGSVKTLLAQSVGYWHTNLVR